MFTKVRNEKGFTLIELLIVVAIIGILAAIAIPQFAAYRIRGFNAAANSDARNAATAEEALFADSQGYGSLTAASAVLAPAIAVVGPTATLAGPLNGATPGAAGSFLHNALGAVPFSLSNGVRISSTTTITAAPVIGTSYVIVAKHNNGDSCYGRDSDSTSMLRGTHVAGTALAITDLPASLVGTNELTGTTGLCATWTAM